jgi:cytochrome c oxidase subunit 1
MPRRIYTYPEGTGWDLLNMASTVGSFIIPLGLVVFFVNVRRTDKKHKRDNLTVEADPWDARSLEWSIPSPVPAYNFIDSPEVQAVDDWWHRKYTEDEDGRMQRLDDFEKAKASAEAHLKPGASVHLPSPSFYPIIAAAGIFLAMYGVVYGRSAGANYVITGLGVLILVCAMIAWALEPSTEPDDALVDPDIDRLLGLAPAGSAQAALGTGDASEPQPALTAGDEGKSGP